MPWPVGELLIEPSTRTIDNLEQRFDRLPAGAWPRAPRQAVVAPMARQGQHRPAGFLVAGINPFRRLDGAYLGFINLVAGQIAAGLANAQSLRGGAQARGSAGGNRQGQDDVFLQCQP